MMMTVEAEKPCATDPIAQIPTLGTRQRLIDQPVQSLRQELPPPASGRLPRYPQLGGNRQRRLACRARQYNLAGIVGAVAMPAGTDGVVAALGRLELTSRNLSECEAEAVALLCCAALGMPGVECCRGYIQSWWGAGIPFRNARRFSA
jgi:hypothetical protein